MSLVRWGENGSHIYIIGSESDPAPWECVNCSLPDSVKSYAMTDEELKTHVVLHKNAGDTVPSWDILTARIDRIDR